MKFWLVVNLAVCTSGFLKNSFERFQWEEWKSNYGKKYNGTEDHFRSKIFFENLGKIKTHNERAAKGLESFLLSVNEMTDMLPQEIKLTKTGLSLANY